MTPEQTADIVSQGGTRGLIYFLFAVVVGLVAVLGWLGRYALRQPALRVADAKGVTETMVAVTRDVTAALNSNTAALTALREAVNTQAEAIQELAKDLATKRR